MRDSRILATFFCIVCSSAVQAITYEEALGQAIGYDKKYAAAIYEAQSSEYLPTIGRAGLLPKLSLSGFQASNSLTQNNPDFFGNTTTTTQNYRSQSYAAQLTQPLINLSALATYLQSKTQANAARQKLAISFNELAANVAEAYYGLASARENFSYTDKELKTLADQERVVLERRSYGAASTTDFEEIRYVKMQTLATLDEAKNGIEQSRITLEKLLGVRVSDREPLYLASKDILLKEGLQKLIDMGQESNPKILYQKFNYESSVYELKKNQGNYAPTLDLTGYQGYQNSNTISTVGQKSKQGYIGLQVNIPIFNGGETYGKEMQSALYAESQRMELQSEINNVEEGIKKTFTQAIISAEKLGSLKKQTESADYLYKSFLEQYLHGSKSTYDLLIATRRKFQSERDVAKAAYEKALAIKRLEILIGKIDP